MSKSEERPDVRILKKATCPTVSGKSTLTYQVGSQPDSSIHLRVTKNTGAGFFSDEWIAMKGIRRVLAEGPKGQPLTSFLLQPLFRGKSVNTPAFLMAALSNEKMLRPLKGRKRGHELLDPEGFINKVEKLMTSEVKAKKSPKKASIKKRSTAKRKSSSA